ncbi:hypothetical protein pipiens_007031 [Culex pipiens pipiens]|uniref:C2H2-type domain-containing protein n=1 Tax=Culex pipiens pipiens TaxID=38569 RepID=A0ABD1DNY7_CULPP
MEEIPTTAEFFLPLDRCFACFSSPGEGHPILGSQSEFNIADMLEKHFWFHRDDFQDGEVLCPDCRNQLESFHRFYLVVEQNHRIKIERKPSPDPTKTEDVSMLPLLEVKLEAPEIADDRDQDQSSSSDDEFKPDDDGGLSTDESDSKSEGDEKHEESPERKKRKYVKRKERGEPPAPRKKINYKVKNAEQLAEEDEIIRTHVQYICEYCQMNCTTFSAYHRHVLDEHNTTKAFILCCGKRYYKKKGLLEHVQRLANPDLFKCEICEKTFVNSFGLQKHTEELHGPEESKIFACSRCPKRFVKQGQLTLHLRGHENLDKELAKCPICDRRYPSEAILRTHIKKSHTRPTDFICDICAKGFYSKSEFMRHKVEHEFSPAELRRQCEICLQWLKNEANWKKHCARHKQGPVTCDICMHVSPTKHSLAAHKRNRHRAPNPALTCQECGKEFKRAISLKEHLASHTGEALYFCTFCPRTFNSNANMFSHRKKMHPQEWLELRNAQQANQFS